MKYSDLPPEKQGFVRKNVELLFEKMPINPDHDLMVLDVYGTEVFYKGKLVSRFKMERLNEE